MTTDARQVLAAAMGKLAPDVTPASSSAMPAFLLEIFEHQVLPDRFQSLIVRNVLLAIALLLLALILALLVRARRRYVGYRQAPLPLDYHRQRELLRSLNEEAN